jgi:hypothetical protein
MTEAERGEKRSGDWWEREATMQAKQATISFLRPPDFPAVRNGFDRWSPLS